MKRTIEQQRSDLNGEINQGIQQQVYSSRPDFIGRNSASLGCGTTPGVFQSTPAEGDKVESEASSSMDD